LNNDLLAPGHRTCAGCGAAIAIRMLLRASGKNVIICNATGCVEVATTPYPETSWRVPWIHSAFENVSAVASGVESAVKFKNRDPNSKLRDTKIIAIGGDGATFDIGIGSLSGMLDRNHDVLYVCYDNEAYMNTGVQKAGSTPLYASTTTSPPGKFSKGNIKKKKDMVKIAAAHGVYSASTTIANFKDFEKKVKKALSIKGAKYLQVLAPCPTGWGHPESKTVEIAKIAVETGIYKLCEYENGKFILNYKPDKRKPVSEYFSLQKRFRHLTPDDIREIQNNIDSEWAEYETH